MTWRQAPRRKPTKWRRRSRISRVPSDLHILAADRRFRIFKVEVDLEAAKGRGSNPVTCAAPRRPCSPAKRSATFPRRKGLRRERVEHAGDPQQLSGSESADGQPQGGHVRMAEWPMSHCPGSKRHLAWKRATDRRQRQRRGRRSWLGRRKKSRRSSKVQFPLGYHPEVLGEYAERRPPRTADVFAIGALGVVSCCCGRVLQRALRVPRVPRAAARAGRRRPRRVLQRRRHLARVAGRLPHGLGHRRPQQDHADHHYQHLEKTKASLRPGAVLRGALERMSPILMTALATALALVPLVVAGDHPRTRDRGPDGHRHPGRAGHVNTPEPVRRALALSAVRQEGSGTS